MTVSLVVKHLPSVAFHLLQRGLALAAGPTGVLGLKHASFEGPGRTAATAATQCLPACIRGKSPRAGSGKLVMQTTCVVKKVEWVIHCCCSNMTPLIHAGSEQFVV